jgi:DNA-binding MarR family transcriptional regulator
MLMAGKKREGELAGAIGIGCAFGWGSKGVAMHRIFFSVKRVHLRVVEESKALLRRFGLTPARFDLLRIIYEYEPHGIPQSEIRLLLGVSATTVSRMLIALEALGFVERTPVDGDRRRLLVKLTDFGWGRYEDADVACVCSGRAEDMARRGVGGDAKLASIRLRLVQKHLNSMRRVFRDGAPFVDPWRMRELVPYHYTTIVNGRIRFTADMGRPRVQYDDDDRRPTHRPRTIADDRAA